MGGGLYVAGSLTVVASRIVGNTATGDSAVEGGGLFANGALDVAYSTIAGNSAVASSVFGNGGGLSASGDVLIDHSTISDNHATDIGGAYLLGADGVATLRIVDSTISGNVGGHVGALMALQSPVTIASSTIAFNSASGTDGIGGLAVANSPTLESTIVAGNAAPNGTADIAANCLGGGDCGLHVIGHANLVGTANLPLPADTLSGDPLLLPLADRGGPTATHALQRGSPAIDAGNATGAGLGPLDSDQRGAEYARVIGVAADIGAYESGAGPDWIFGDGFDCIHAHAPMAPQVEC